MATNPITQLDSQFNYNGRDWPLRDIAALEAEPDAIVVPAVGDEFTVEVRAVDASGRPLPNTEARINPLFDPEFLQFVHACGGRDREARRLGYRDPPAACDGLRPSYHLFDNDGVMWFTFRAVKEGLTSIIFAYPGILIFQPGPLSDSDSEREMDYTNTVLVPVSIGVDEDGDGVPDLEDDCPNTPPNTVVDGTNGCPVTTSTPPTLAEVASSVYIFRKQSSQLGCSGTVTQNNTPAQTTNEGGLTPLKLETFFTADHGGPTSTVRGPYNPADGTYIANGTDEFGNVHELDGVWTFDEADGAPRFDGTLVERKFSPTCENTFAVTYTAG